ncbi:MAG: azoR2 [Polaromonas sp.]|nr:azoR2 [Polaromonas sp.]
MTAFTSILHLAASPRGDLSNSHRLGTYLSTCLHAARPELAVVERRLGIEPLPPPDATFAAENVMPAESRRHASLSEALIRELEAAAIVVISTPMHNFTVPTGLKAWIDQIVRPGRTFRSTAQGKVGLLAPRPVFSIVTCGGPIGAGGGTQQDFLTPYLAYLLGTIGLPDVRPLLLHGLNMPGLDVDAALAGGRVWIDQEVAQLAR